MGFFKHGPTRLPDDWGVHAECEVLPSIGGILPSVTAGILCERFDSKMFKLTSDNCRDIAGKGCTAIRDELYCLNRVSPMRTCLPWETQ